MAIPFYGQISMFGFNYAPKDWALCDGQVVAISQNPAVYALLSNRYGGDGVNTYAYPDLRGRVPICQGALYSNFYDMGDKGGVETVALSELEMGSHTHNCLASNQIADKNGPSTKRRFALATQNIYASAENLVALFPATSSPSGGGQPHNNVQPTITINFCIALDGIFPSRN